MNEKLEYIIGIPSGMIINIYESDLYYLDKSVMIYFDKNIYEFVFDDEDFNNIIKILGKIKLNDFCQILGTNKIGKLIKIVEYNSQYKNINGLDLSKIYSYGDMIYILKFPNGKNGLYLEENLVKINPPNDIFL